MHIVNKRSAISAAILASAVYSSSVMSGVLGVEARALGMGNVSVATADIATAALGNPAMLSYQPDSEDFSLLISVGVVVSDGDDMIGDIDDFQDAAFSLAQHQSEFAASPDQVANVNQQIDDVNNMTASATSLDGKTIEPSAPVAVVLGFSFEEYAMAVAYRQDLFAATGLVNSNFGAPVSSINNAGQIPFAQGEIAAIETAFNTPGDNEIAIDGAIVNAITLSIAKSYDFDGQKISFGITPKIVTAEGFQSASFIGDFDTDVGELIDSNNTVDLGSTFTMDVGVVSQISESTHVGLLITNIIEDTLNSGAGAGSVNVGRRITLGLAYRDDWFTVGTDIDLVEVDPIVTTVNVSSTPTQIVSFGAEFDIGSIVQLRAGVQKNIASNIAGAGEALLTAGLGLNLGFNLDFALTASDNTYGLIAQTGFKF